MDSIELNARLETRKDKNGNTYQCIVVDLTDTYKKLVFLTPAEKELIKLYNE